MAFQSCEEVFSFLILIYSVNFCLRLTLSKYKFPEQRGLRCCGQHPGSALYDLCLWGRVWVRTPHSTQTAKKNAAFLSLSGGYSPISVQFAELDPLHWLILSTLDYKYLSLEVNCSVSQTFSLALCLSTKWPLVTWRGMVAEGFFLCPYKEHHSKACHPLLCPHSPWDWAMQWRESLALFTITQDCRRWTCNFSTAPSLLPYERGQYLQPSLGRWKASLLCPRAWSSVIYGLIFHMLK